MHKIYNSKELKFILAYEQYKQFKTPPIYNEISKINEFLEDKKSVTVELHNGTKIKAEAYLNSILDILPSGEIFIADRYCNKVIEGEPIDYRKCLGTELKCIKFSRNILNIESEVFTHLKQESIEKTEDEHKEEIIEDDEEEEL